MKRVAGIVLYTTILLLGILATHHASAETFMKEPDFPVNWQSWPNPHNEFCTTPTEKPKTFFLSIFWNIDPAIKEIQTVRTFTFNKSIVYHTHTIGTSTNPTSKAYDFIPNENGWLKLDMNNEVDAGKSIQNFISKLGEDDIRQLLTFCGAFMNGEVEFIKSLAEKALTK